MDLTGQMLIAMPGMSDTRFARSLVCLLSHSDDDGAMGLIVNKPLPRERADAILGHLPTVPDDSPVPVHYGGPVEKERGFVLHSGGYGPRVQTTGIVPGVEMSATLDSLENVSNDGGPQDARLMIGYAGWAPGQLETEIMQNGWLVCPVTPELVFAQDCSASWTSALQSIGVDPRTLSATSGNA